jgi:hypothetical protein
VRYLLILLAVVILAWSVPAGVAAAQEEELAVRLACDSDRRGVEYVTVSNHSSQAITIQSVGSLYKPRADEPFPRNDRLRPGGSITYEAGSGARSNTLTRESTIFRNTAREEGVQVQTSAGLVTVLCSDGPSSSHLIGLGYLPVSPAVSPAAQAAAQGAAMLPRTGGVPFGLLVLALTLAWILGTGALLRRFGRHS